jgi:glutamyl-tRNA synthetase
LKLIQPARVRFAPSPTGRMHMGSARTALYNYLLARRTGGQFILRIEDTDFNRYVEGAEQELMDGLRWLGLDWDEGVSVGGPYSPYHQSERKGIYLKYAQELIDKGFAYPCFCSKDRLDLIRKEQIKRKQNPHYDGTCRNLSPEEVKRRISSGESHVIRFKTPKEGTITVRDTLRGDITVENKNINDYILVNSDGWALYHLAAMVDDHLMKITHVIRGSEWLPTFPLHAHIIRAFGWQEPRWFHLSVFLKPSGKGKMSKRDAAEALDSGYSIFVTDLKKQGYVPEGVLNWLLLMGWGIAEGEFMSLDEMVQHFDISKVNPSPAAIDFAKLDFFSGAHIRQLDQNDLASRVKPFFENAGFKVDDDLLSKIIPIIRERLVTLEDAIAFAAFFFKDQIDLKAEDLVGKKLTPEKSLEVLRKSNAIFSSLDEISHEKAEPPMRGLVGELGLKAGQVFGILRMAVTGQQVSPPLFESMEIIGKEKVQQRIDNAISCLESSIK